MKSIVPLLSLLFPGLLLADSVTLKSGREFVGEVIDNGPGGVLIDYFVTPTIKDQKFIPKDDIAKVLIVPPDDRAYKALGSLTAPPTVLETSFYDTLIDKKIPEFIAKYPYSSHLGDLRKELVALDAERSRIRRGERKIDGQWFSPEMDADPYQSGAKLRFAEMKEYSQARDPVSVLKSYELLEKNFPGASVMPSAVPLALQQLNLLQDKLSQALANYPVLDARRKDAIRTAPVDQAQEIKDAVDKEVLLSKQAAAAALADGSRFFPVFQNTKASMEALQSLTKSERDRLQELQKVPMSAGISSEKESSRFLDQGNLKGAQESYDVSAKLWSVNYNLLALRKKIDTAVNSVNATKEGTRLLASGNLKDARESCNTAVKLWPVNPDIAELKARLASAEESLRASSECARLLGAGNTKEAQDQMESALKLWPANPEIPALKAKLELATKKPQK